MLYRVVSIAVNGRRTRIMGQLHFNVAEGLVASLREMTAEFEFVVEADDQSAAPAGN